MGVQHTYGNAVPVTTSVGCLRVRTFSIVVTPTGYGRWWEGTTSWYRTLTTTTTYAGVTKNNPDPTPDVTYTATPGISTESVTRGWNVATTIHGDLTEDLDDPPSADDEPTVWTPPLASGPSWGSPTATETETTYVETSAALGSWSGTKTVTQEWSDKITDSDMVNALEEARDAVIFPSDAFNLQTGNGPAGLSYIADPDFGTKSLVAADYSLGAYTGRKSIAAIQVVAASFDYGSPEPFVAEQFSTDLTDVVDVPPGGFFGQESFRDDNKQLFGGWRRVDLHEIFPSQTVVTGNVFLYPLSGHVFVTESTGTTTSDSGYVGLGGAHTGPWGPDSFLWSHGSYSPP
jgi:hypothetical protein